MAIYANRGGRSGIISYELGSDAIIVTFSRGGSYLYNGQRPGSHHVRQMVRYARMGEGLNTYINQHVRKLYARRLG